MCIRDSRQTLWRLFGTPDEPKAPAGVRLDLELLKIAAGPASGDALGNAWGLFRRYCAVCHGVSGDGAGPAASMLDPYPRDFRNGLFKYSSTSDGAKPTQGDLERTIVRGVAGTAMPSFAHLSSRQLAALSEYIKYLSIRGQTELSLIQLIVDEGEATPVDMRLVMSEAVAPAAESWEMPERLMLVVRPPPKSPAQTPQARAASIARGRELYLRKDAQCVKCHGPEGAGDGEEAELYDDWNKRKRGVTPEQTKRLARLFTLPLQKLRPRDFRQGIFRGGNRPEDLFWRICVGIKGTPMPAAGPGRSSSGAYTAEEIWPLVDYILSLSRRRATEVLAAGS